MPIRIDAKSTGRQLSRYITYSTFVKLDDNDPENKKIAYEKKGYHVEWANVKNDLKYLIKNPIRFAPQVAYSLAAFWFIFQGKHQEAMTLAFSGIAFDATSAAVTSGAQTAVSVSHTCTGSERCLVSGIEIINATVAWTYAGTAIVEDTTSTNDMNEKMGHLIAPASGANTLTHTIAVGEAGHGIFGISFTGAHQTTQPDQASPTPATGTSTAPSISVTTTTDNSIVVDNLIVRTTTLTVDVSQTQIANQAIDSATARKQGGSYEQKVSAGAMTMSWSLADSKLWTLQAVTIRESGTVVAGTNHWLLTGV